MSTVDNPNIVTLVNGYSRITKTSKPELLRFRRIQTVVEAVEHCSRNSHIWFQAINGEARKCKVNGKVRTWKRDPERVEIPVKYGMYEYGTFTEQDINRILIPVEE